jgi:hypothetical protein
MDNGSSDGMTTEEFLHNRGRTETVSLGSHKDTMDSYRILVREKSFVQRLLGKESVKIGDNTEIEFSEINCDA